MQQWPVQDVGYKPGENWSVSPGIRPHMWTVACMPTHIINNAEIGWGQPGEMACVISAPGK